MKHSETRILTTHTGSLPRPEGLVEMLGAVSRGESVDDAALESLAGEATAEVVSAQLAAGVDVINNGEQSRVSFSTYVTQRMSGFGGSWDRRGQRDQNEFPSVVRPRVVQLMSGVPTCVGPVTYERLDLVEQECRQLLSAVNAAEGEPEDLFMTAASPGIVSLTLANRYYDSHEDYVFALAEELRKEYEIIVANGLTLQLDCPDWPWNGIYPIRTSPCRPFRTWSLCIFGRSITPSPTSPRIGCACTYAGATTRPPPFTTCHWSTSSTCFTRLRSARWLWKWQTRATVTSMVSTTTTPCPKACCWRAGVIDTKTNYVEHPRLVADRVHQAVTAAGGDVTRVMIGTDCGFDTSAGSNRVDAGVVWLKLQAMREGAEIASRELF